MKAFKTKKCRKFPDIFLSCFSFTWYNLCFISYHYESRGKVGHEGIFNFTSRLFCAYYHMWYHGHKGHHADQQGGLW